MGDALLKLLDLALQIPLAGEEALNRVGQLGLGSPGVTTPVLVRGPWTQLRYEPDLAGLAKNVVDVPVDMLKGVVEIPGKVFGSGKPANEDDGKSRNPFKGIFGK